MDAPCLPSSSSPSLRRVPVRGPFAVARSARRVAACASPPPAPRPLPPGVPLGLDDVAGRLAFRPAAFGALAALVAAVALHLGVGGASASIRPAKRGATTTTSVAVEAAPELLAEDVPAAPPPPERPPPPASDVARLPSSSSPSPTSAPAPAALPGLSPTSFGAGPGGAGGGGFAAGGDATLPSSAPQAAVQTTPTVRPARAISRPPPRYPAGARRDGVTGVVTLAIEVDTGGHILAVRVVESEPAGVFDAAAVESVRAWRFEPATRDGVPVTTWVRQTIRFTLEGA